MLLYLVCLAFIIVAQRYGIYKNFHKKIPPDRISPKGWENFAFIQFSKKPAYLLASSIATATATVIPTMGLLPAPNARCRAGSIEEKALSKPLAG